MDDAQRQAWYAGADAFMIVFSVRAAVGPNGALTCACCRPGDAACKQAEPGKG